MKRTRLTRRELCQAGVAGLLLGPALVHAKLPLEGLSCELEVTASSSGLVLELYLVNARAEPVRWSEPLHRPTLPSALLHDGERPHALALRPPANLAKRPMTRSVPRRTIVIAEGTKARPTRYKYGRFTAPWPEGMAESTRTSKHLRAQATFHPRSLPTPLRSALAKIRYAPEIS